ncbi:MAG: hypothetical protein WA304_10900 [Candidatus Cybelea sp.]
MAVDEQMAVGVSGNRDTAVPEPIAESLHVYPMRDQDGGRGVAQVVQPECTDNVWQPLLSSLVAKAEMMRRFAVRLASSDLSTKRPGAELSIALLLNN